MGKRYFLARQIHRTASCRFYVDHNTNSTVTVIYIFWHAQCSVFSKAIFVIYRYTHIN